ncbi:MAG: hypothetical protein FD180_3295 [Planctomycetota bacterium]|nr:MAG: hypothetical protein FD180_3295 [Planctomycetota bacterium]
MSVPVASLPMSPPVVLISTIVTGIFPDRASADRAWDAAIARGYATTDLSVAVSDEMHKKHFIVQRQPTETKALEGAAVGGAIGTTAGALAVVMAVGVSILLPGLGIVIAGPIVAAFAAAGAGGAIGGLIGGLAGLDIPEKHVKLIEDHVRKGHVILTLKARSAADAEAIQKDWKAWAVEVLF